MAQTEFPALAQHVRKIAALASSVAMSHFRNPLNVAFKADASPVTQADQAVEAAVRSYLQEHFPDHGVFGEEQGVTGLDNPWLWVVDPIDGTRSFLSGQPLFGFLLALLRDKKPLAGVVSMPALDELFVGIAGEGARLNGIPISVSQTVNLDQAILYVNEGDKIYHSHPALFERLMQAGQTRRFAYDCYPHALLAAGHVDAVVDFDLQPYDFLPVSALIEAAGGIMTDWAGQPLTLQSPGAVVSAATPELHHTLLDLLDNSLFSNRSRTSK